MVKSNGGIIGPDNVTTGGFSGVASGVFKLGEVTDLIKESKWPEVSPFINTIPNSVRLDGGGTYFSRTQTAGNRRTWTQSGWYKFDGIDPGNAQSLVSTNGTNTGTNFHYTLEKGGSSGGAVRYSILSWLWWRYLSNNTFTKRLFRLVPHSFSGRYYTRNFCK